MNSPDLTHFSINRQDSTKYSLNCATLTRISIIYGSVFTGGANNITYFCCLSIVIPVISEALELDLNLTRKEVITFLGQTANLACYATNTNSPLTYSWTKANQTVTQSSYIRAVGHVLVVTPMEEKHFGNYMCNISDGASSATCLISLSKGINETGNYKYANRDHCCCNREATKG